MRFWSVFVRVVPTPIFLKFQENWDHWGSQRESRERCFWRFLGWRWKAEKWRSVYTEHNIYRFCAGRNGAACVICCNLISKRLANLKKELQHRFVVNLGVLLGGPGPRVFRLWRVFVLAHFLEEKKTNCRTLFDVPAEWAELPGGRYV